MGTKQSKPQVKEEDVTTPAVETPKATFEERTAQGQPWRNKDGSENRGEVVESEPVVTGDAPDEEKEPTEEDE